jgi:nucleotide-binding universal stress UspA family protein
MYRTILVGYDGSGQGEDALALAEQLAESTGAALIVARVLAPGSLIAGGSDPQVQGADVEQLRRLERAAGGVDAQAQTLMGGSVPRGLQALAEENGADLIVVGSSHRGRVGRTLAGGVATGLLHGAPCAVAVAPRGYRDQTPARLDAVVAGFDGSGESGQALMAAWQLAQAAQAKLRIVAVAVEPLHDQLRESLAEARRTVPDGLEVDATLPTGDPVEVLKEAGGAPGTMLVVGSRGYGPLRRVLLGSVSTKLVRGTPCPLLVTPRGPRKDKGLDQPADVPAAP